MECSVSEKTGRAIQAAIDEAAQAGGGRVRLEPGVFLSGTLYLRSNVELNIPAGSRIQGYDSPEAYDDFTDPGFDAVAPEKSRKCLIACANAENVSITGAGEINGAGPAFYDRNVPEGAFFAKPPHPRPRMVQFYNCRNVLFSGVSFIDSPGWTFWLIACEDVNITRVRVAGCQQMINNDGIDLDGCRRVTVSDSFFRTGDDCIILRAIRKRPDVPVVCEEVLVTQCALDSRCQGIRIGCPSDDTIRNCSFSHLTFRGTGIGIHCESPLRYLGKNCQGYLKVSDIRFSDIDIASGSHPIRIFCEGGIRLRELSRFSFSNIVFKGKKPLWLEGTADSPIDGVRFDNVSGVIEADVPLVARHVRDLKLGRFDVTACTGPAVPLKRAESSSWEAKR
jgi:polygalacturonase